MNVIFYIVTMKFKKMAKLLMINKEKKQVIIMLLNHEITLFFIDVHPFKNPYRVCYSATSDLSMVKFFSNNSFSFKSLCSFAYYSSLVNTLHIMEYTQIAINPNLLSLLYGILEDTGWIKSCASGAL
jgi:hypothetical protein